MELEFHKSMCNCLNPVVGDIRNQEQTQEVKLSEGMPDVGRILASWGQCLLRSKEWRSGNVGVSGGVMTWTLYMPEESAQPVCVEAWVPFHMKWDLPNTQRDGVIRAGCSVCHVEARTLSARRILVRTELSVWAEALEPTDREIMMPVNMPDDIQLLRQVYPLLIPREAGEKSFVLEDEFLVSSADGVPEKIISYQMRTEILDKKVIGQRVAFRGNGRLHLIYQGEDGKIHCCDQEIPFSQLVELEQDYDSDCEIDILPAVTSLEVDLMNDKIQVKCGMTAQYLVRVREMVELIRDAYSPRRTVNTVLKELNLPVVLDQRQENRRIELEVPSEPAEIADTVMFLDYPHMLRGSEMTELELNGHIQVLYYDQEDHLQLAEKPFDEKIEIPISAEAELQASVSEADLPQVIFSGNGIHANNMITLQLTTVSDCGIPMVVGLEAGDEEEPDPNRPSLILRKTGDEPLWEVAKQCGSTVDAIRTANKLLSEPENGQVLLIPIP